jgi:hypothetical protein
MTQKKRAKWKNVCAVWAIYRNPMNVRSVTSEARLQDLWHRHLLPKGLPLLLGTALALLLAVFIAYEQWLFALPLILIVPVAIVILRDPFAAVLIWLAVMPWFPFDVTYKYVHYAAHRLLLPAALVIIILSRMFRLKRHSTVKLEPADVAMAAFGAMVLVSTASSGKDWTILFVLQDQVLVPFVAYWIIRLLDVQGKELKRLMPLILVLALAECAVGLLSWLAPQAVPSIWHSPLLGDRVIGSFRQPVAYAYVMIFFMVLLFYDAMSREKGPLRKWEILAFVLGMVCLLLTYTRGAWLAGILSLAALLYLYPKPIAASITVLFCLVLVLPRDALEKEIDHAYERLFNKDTAQSRIVLANAGKNMFLAKPIFGWGYGDYDRYDYTFMERVNEFSPSEWDVREGTSHSTYLTTLAETGIVGLFLYTFPIFWWLILTLKALPRLPKHGFWSGRLLVALWLPIGAFVVSAQDIDMRFFYYCLTLFWINLALIGSMVRSCLRSSDSGSI